MKSKTIFGILFLLFGDFALATTAQAQVAPNVTRMTTTFHVTEISRSADALMQALRPIDKEGHPLPQADSDIAYVWTVKGYADNKVAYVAACKSTSSEQYVTKQDGTVVVLLPCPLPEVGKSYQVTIQRIGMMPPTIEFKSAIALPPNHFPGFYKVIGTPLASVEGTLQ